MSWLPCLVVLEVVLVVVTAEVVVVVVAVVVAIVLVAVIREVALFRLSLERPFRLAPLPGLPAPLLSGVHSIGRGRAASARAV